MKASQVQADTETVCLIGIQMQGQADHEAWGLLSELRELVENLGWVVACQEMVHLNHFSAEFLLGSGKTHTIIQLAQAHQASMIVLDQALSPSQGRNWEKASGLRVLDRQEVILNIFLERAQTEEAVLQVDLACMEYMLPRLKRAWTHLSRQRGGASTQRGEGEKQIELDQRLVRQRISKLKKEIKDVERHRDVQRSKRLKIPIPSAAIVGYTNVGKSSLLNALTHAHVLAEDKLFATLDPSTRRVCLPSGQPFLLTDTVGFIRRLPHRLIEAFKATLEESLYADFLIHVLDVTSDSVDDHYQTTTQVLAELGAGDKPVLIVFNKIDQLTDDCRRVDLQARFPGNLWISAKTQQGIDLLYARIQSLLDEQRVFMQLNIPFDEYAIVHRLHEVGAVLKEKAQDNGVYLSAYVPKPWIGLVQRFKQSPDQSIS